MIIWEENILPTPIGENMMPKQCRKMLPKNIESKGDLNVDGQTYNYKLEQERRRILQKLERMKAEALIRAQRASIR